MSTCRWSIYVISLICTSLSVFAMPTCKDCSGRRTLQLHDNNHEDHVERSHGRREPVEVSVAPNNKNSTKAPRNKCCPYEFDRTICRIIDDRVLCGYNLNKGKIKSKSASQDYHGGCRLRGGRLECGYGTPPFKNKRRPPAWDNYDVQEGGNGPKEETEPMYEKDNDKVVELDSITTKGSVVLSTARPNGLVTRCVEKDGRVVCNRVTQ